MEKSTYQSRITSSINIWCVSKAIHQRDLLECDITPNTRLSAAFISSTHCLPGRRIYCAAGQIALHVSWILLSGVTLLPLRSSGHLVRDNCDPCWEGRLQLRGATFYSLRGIQLLYFPSESAGWSWAHSSDVFPYALFSFLVVVTHCSGGNFTDYFKSQYVDIKMWQSK